MLIRSILRWKTALALKRSCNFSRAKIERINTVARHVLLHNHQPHDCLLNRLSRRRSKKTSKLRVTGLCVGNSPVTGEFPAQMASNTENVSIWWRHHEGMDEQLHITKQLWMYSLIHALISVVLSKVLNIDEQQSMAEIDLLQAHGGLPQQTYNVMNRYLLRQRRNNYVLFRCVFVGFPTKVKRQRIGKEMFTTDLSI